MGAPRRARRAQGAAEPVVALLEQRGRYLVGAPVLPAAAPRRRRDGAPAQHAVERTKDARPGRLALLRPGAARRQGRARVLRDLGRPDNARDVIEALMLHRGLRRSFPGP
jgi:ribonuclease R